MPSCAGAKSSQSASLKGADSIGPAHGEARLYRPHLGLALGGRPATGFAKRLMLPVSKDTCCASSHVVAVRRLTRLESLALTIGPGGAITDTPVSSTIWKSAGSSRSCHVVKPATAQAWLTAHPTIEIVGRDRGGGYGGTRARQTHQGLTSRPRFQAKTRPRWRILIRGAIMPRIRARTPEQAWARRAVGEGVKFCPRAGCGKSACPVR
jgi:hypothetical protein